MTRRSLSSILSNQEQSLQEVWSWYEFQRALVGEEKSRVLALLASGADLGPSRYIGKTHSELDDEFTYQAAELGQLTMLGMLACTEAALRVDFIQRVKNKKKDNLSRAFSVIYQAREIENVRLEEDILHGWTDEFGGPLRGAVAEFKGTLNLRHWLAHGRYWKPKLGRAAGYDPVDVFDICKGLLQTMDLMPADVPGR